MRHDQYNGPVLFSLFFPFFLLLLFLLLLEKWGGVLKIRNIIALSFPLVVVVVLKSGGEVLKIPNINLTLVVVIWLVVLIYLVFAPKPLQYRISLFPI